ncbi:MAG TPA: glycoside hydrolase family 15 protein, partial [Terriglobales bacterium]
PIFAALLDAERGGHWTLAPASECKNRQRYREDTNVLVTEWSAEAGSATVTDLVPVTSEELKRRQLLPEHEFVREVRCTAGEMRFVMEFHPRPEYGRAAAKIRAASGLGYRMEIDGAAYWFRTNIPLTIGDDRATASFKMKQGEVAQFVLAFSQHSPAVLPALGEPLSGRIEESVRWWRAWADRSSYDGEYREAVRRSALTLKLLSYAPSGAIVAAPTTSLPEIIGADLNWDYRYCWLRDASLTVRALLGLGYIDEAKGFLTWMLHATQLTQPELRTMYDIFGGLAPRERDLEHLSGYENSRPVRVGNGARNQLQLDIYGEVIDAAAQYSRLVRRFDRTTQNVLVGFGTYVAKNWNQPDEGIWEPRSGRQNHTHSRVMCWTALDRLLEMHQKGTLKNVPVELFARERERIKLQILDQAWNEKVQSYAATLGGDSVDATLLRISWYGLERVNSERMKKTYARVRKDLGAGDSLLYRYAREPKEGAFGICGFWGAEYLATGGGTLEEAHDCFKNLLAYRNELGLYSEEIDPETGDALGNYPQAFTHIGLISTALSLKEREKGEPHPAERRQSGPSTAQRSAAQ